MHSIYHQQDSDNPVAVAYTDYNWQTNLPYFIELMHSYINLGIAEDSDFQAWAADYNEYHGTDFNPYKADEWSWEAPEQFQDQSEYLGSYSDAPSVLYENSAQYDAIWAPDTSNWTEDETVQFNLLWDPTNTNQATEWIEDGMSSETYGQMEEYAEFLTIANYGIDEFEASQVEGYSGPLEEFAGNENLPEEEDFEPEDYRGASTIDAYFIHDWASPTGEKLYLSNRQVWEIQNDEFDINGRIYSGETLLNTRMGPIGYDENPLIAPESPEARQNRIWTKYKDRRGITEGLNYWRETDSTALGTHMWPGYNEGPQFPWGESMNRYNYLDDPGFYDIDPFAVALGFENFYGEDYFIRHWIQTLPEWDEYIRDALGEFYNETLPDWDAGIPMPEYTGIFGSVYEENYG